MRQKQLTDNTNTHHIKNQFLHLSWTNKCVALFFNVTGYCVELAEHLKRIIQMDYVFRLVKDGNYGQKLPNNTWDGMIGELTRRVSTNAAFCLLL